MKEKDFQLKFTRWLHYRYPANGVFELKICKGTSLPFDAVQPHQVAALVAAQSTGIEYKIPDDTRGTKPFDCFRLKAPAFVVVQFYSPGSKEFVMIDIDVWINESETSDRKSLTPERALQIGTVGRFE